MASNDHAVTMSRFSKNIHNALQSKKNKLFNKALKKGDKISQKYVLINKTIIKLISFTSILKKLSLNISILCRNASDVLDIKVTVQ